MKDPWLSYDEKLAKDHDRIMKRFDRTIALVAGLLAILVLCFLIGVFQCHHDPF